MGECCEQGKTLTRFLQTSHQRLFQVIAWRIRNPDLPLLLESTAAIVEARLREEQGKLPLSALKLVFATAVSRCDFVCT